MEILLVAVVALGNIACFAIGAKVGQKVSRGEEIRLPKVDPLEGLRRGQERKETKLERERMDTILRNIDLYDGSGAHQADIPGR